MPLPVCSFYPIPFFTRLALCTAELELAGSDEYRMAPLGFLCPVIPPDGTDDDAINSVLKLVVHEGFF